MICPECQNPLTKEEERHANERYGLCRACFIVRSNLELGLGSDPLESVDAKTFSLAQAARYLTPWTTRRDRKES